MTRPTVCIDCRYIRERPSGIATIVQALSDHLPALAPDLEFFLLKHPKAPPRLSAAPNVRETVVRAEANGPATLLWLPRVVSLRGVDLFHATFNILPAGLAMPTVVTLCDVMWMKHPDWARSPGAWGIVETLFYRNGIRRALGRATRIVAISEATRAEIGSLDRAAFERTRVAHEGVDPAVYRPLAGEEGRAFCEETRRRRLPGARRYVLAVGQFAPYKNHPMVVRAFARAFRDEPDVHLALVQRLGRGRQVLEPLARELGVAERVHFLHDLPVAEVVALFHGALCLCHPSLYEGFGNCPAEAMACGCPVVTSNRSAMPEVSGVAALLVDPESVEEVAAALRRVASDPELAASMRARGLARAAELTWRSHAERTLAVYREILSAGGARG
jgi:glycosyltransferase involved in cell wall biosynthesis